MPRHPLGDKAMTDAERQRKRRERLRKESPILSDRQKLAHALAEIERLKQQLAAAARQEPAKAAHELDEARAEIKRLRNAETMARLREASLRDEVERLKAKIVKPAKVPLDPESEAVRQIDALKKRNKTLREEANKWLVKLRTLVPTPVKNKIAKALREETTSRAIRFDALQAWNGLGLNNLGR